MYKTKEPHAKRAALLYTRTMETKKDYSYGVVLFTNHTEPQVLLVEQIGMRGDVFWTLPKGHPEAAEEPQETALREFV